MWNWYKWDSIEEFNAWHDALCVSLGYPLNSYNQATGEIDSEATKTTAYTSPSFVGDKVIATVEEKYSTGLTITELRLPTEPQR
jgi:hypothetical protein